MNIDELKSKAEDIEPELTPEQKETQEKFFRGNIVKRFKSEIKALYQQMYYKHKTIAEIKQSIIDKDKTNSFTLRQREFIMAFKDEFLVDLLKDVYKKKDLNEINLTVGEFIQTGTGDTRNVQSNS